MNTGEQAEGKSSIQRLSLIKQDTLKAHKKPVCRSLLHKIPTERLELQGNQQFIIASSCCVLQRPCIKLQSSAAHKADLQMPGEGLGPSHAGLHVAWISRLDFLIFRFLLHLLKAEKVSSLLPSTGCRAARVRYVTPPPPPYFLVSGWLPKSSLFRDHPVSCSIPAAAQTLLCTSLATSDVTGKQCVACVTLGQFYFRFHRT